MSIEPGPTDQAPDAEAASPPSPTYITAEQFMAFQTQQTQTLQSINESLAAMRSEAARRPDAAPAATEHAVTAEEYASAVQTGDAGTIERYFDQKQRRYHAAEVAPMQRDGAQILGDMQARLSASTLPHYTRFKKEIDAAYAQMPPQLRAMPEAITIAHDLVSGRHVGELVAEAREAALRTPAVQPNAPGAANGRAVRTDNVPSAEDWLGKDNARALGNVSEDDFARRLGYKDWAAYHAVYREQVAAGEAR